MADDFLRFEASFSKLDEAVQQFVGRLEEELLALRAQGDEVRASQVENQIAAMKGPASGAGGASSVQDTTAALRGERAQLDLNLQRQLEILDTMRLQAREATALAEMNRQAGLTPELIVPPGTRTYTSYGQTIGQQAAAERELAAQQQYVNDLALAEGTGRARTLALEQEQLALDRQRLSAMEAQKALASSLAREQEVLLAQSAAYKLGSQGAAAGRFTPPATFTTGGPLTGAFSGAQKEAVLMSGALGQYDTFAARGSLTTAALSTNLTRLGIAEAEASNTLRAHGALTTEYLSALARGETTVKEFGYQIGATIGKFAGWTAAATATYTALGAVYEFGKGAIDASSGVQQLTRTIDGLDRNKAGLALQNLSQDTNVPIKEASDAVFAFSRTFHTLGDAVAAARLGLSAFKLDNVSLADSVKASTAIHQQFGVSAQGLSGVYDQLAAGQREYNARISEMIPLLQKSTGAVANAGGKLDNLIQLGVYAQRITQLSGAQIGTAFYRSAATFLNPSTTKGQTDRTVLQSLGINPNQNWTKIIQDALIKSVTLSPNDRSRVANAVFGPQYGGRLSAIFNPQGIPTYQQIAGLGGDPRRAITPSATRGSLQTELDRELGRVTERLHGFVNEMQRFGAALGQSGVLNVFGLFISGATGVLSVLRSLINEFDQLPSSIRTILESVVALRALSLFTSRTQFGSSLADATRLNRLPGFGASDAQQARFELRGGTTAALDSVNASFAQTRVRLLSVGQQQLILEEQRAAIEKEIADAGVGSRAQVEESNRINAQILALQSEQNGLEIQQNAEQAVRERLLAQRTALERSPTRGGYTDPQVLALQARTNAGTSVASTSATTRATAATAEGTAAATAEAGATEADTAAQGAFARAKSRLGVMLGLNAAASSEAAAAEAKNVVAAEAAAEAAGLEAGSVTAGATGLRGLVAALDPLTVGLIALPIVFEEISNAVHHAGEAARKASQATAAPVSSIADLQRNAQALVAAANKQASTNVSSSLPGFLGRGENVILKAGEQALGMYAGDPGKTRIIAQFEQQLYQHYTEYADQYRQDATTLIRTQAGRKRLAEEAAKFEAAAAAGARSGFHFDPQEIGKAVQGFANSLATIRLQVADAATHIRGAQGLILLEQRSLSTSVNEMQAISDRAKVYGATKGDIDRLARIYEALAAAYASSHDSKALQQVDQAQQLLINTIQTDVQNLVTQAEATTNKGAKLSLLNQARAELAQGTTAVHRSEQQLITAIKATIAQNEAMVGEILVVGHTVATVGTAVADAGLNIVGGLLGLSAQERKVTAISKTMDAAIAGALKQLHQQNATLTAQIGALGHVNDVVNAQLQQQLHSINSQTTAASKVPKTPTTPASQDPFELTRLQRELQQARDYFNPVQVANDAVSLAQDEIAAARNQHERLQALIDLANAQHQLDSAIEDVAQSRFDYLISATTDPIKQAKLKVQQAAQKVAFDASHGGLDTATAYKDRASLNQARQDLTKSIADTDMRTLDFELHTQKITDQQYINGLQRLLRLKHLTLEQRQQILSQIFDATHQAALDLGTDNIKLPTTYEVRRAIRSAMHRAMPRPGEGGAGGTSVQNNTTNHVDLRVYVHKNADIGKVAHTIDQSLKSNFTGAAQAAGLI